jgi:hypothetical protein
MGGCANHAGSTAEIPFVMDEGESSHSWAFNQSGLDEDVPLPFGRTNTNADF